MCNCQTWARVPTGNFNYPQPNHHPDCEDYKLEPFVRIEHCDGGHCVMEPREAAGFVADGGGEYTTTDIRLTRDQFDKIKDFEGF
jgi:hypothetical protein